MVTACIEQGWSACDGRLREVPTCLADASVSVGPDPTVIVPVVRSRAPHCRIPEWHGIGDAVCTGILNAHVRRKGLQRRCTRALYALGAMGPVSDGCPGPHSPKAAPSSVPLATA
jgi:hypothetical protein